MFEHYLPNKNEGATVAPKSKFRKLNKGSMLVRAGAQIDRLVTSNSCTIHKYEMAHDF